jgi:hypothetical protein
MELKTTLWEYAGDTAQQRALKGAPRVRSGVASGKLTEAHASRAPMRVTGTHLDACIDTLDASM